MEPETAKIEELKAVIAAVRDRVRARYPEPDRDGYTDGGSTNGVYKNGASNGHGGGGAIRIPLADLMPVVNARDAAQAKIAAIGSVNPRERGIVNDAIQTVKKTIARGLQWFVRDQVAFNREIVAALEAVIEALNEHNRGIAPLAAHANRQAEQIGSALTGLADMRSSFEALRSSWDSKVAANEIQFLRSVADLQGAFQHRTTLIESNFREIVKAQHADFEGALERADIDIQKQLWRDLEKIRLEYDRLIHTELRLIRQRGMGTGAVSAAAPAAVREPAAATSFDYARFAERFRGPKEYVRRNVEFYKPFFAGCENVLDIGCGRGEFLCLMREQGVAARGIDLSEESVAQCRQHGLKAEIAELFTYLASQPEEEFDGIFSSQVVEHLDPQQLPEMVRLCASRLQRGGVLAIETPNPECLAIFAEHFYLDPTHKRPVPHPLLAFYMEEAGLGGIEVHELSPAVESMPELAALPENFRKRFFGGLDYAIVGRRL